MKKHDDIDDDIYDYDDVDSSAPEVASPKGSKITIIAFSALLISLVLYFLFFKGGSQDVKKSDPVKNLSQDNYVSESPAEEGGLEDFDDIFNDLEQSQSGDDVILETPDIPKLPGLEKSDTDSDDLSDIFGVSDSKKNKSDKRTRKRRIVTAEGEVIFIDEPLEEGLSLPEIGNLDSADQRKPSLAERALFPSGQDQESTSLPEPTPINPNSQFQDDLPKPLPIIVFAGSPGPTNSVGYENNIINLNEDPIDRLEVNEPEINSQYIKDRSTTLIQGKIISAVLETSINTEFPGEVRGIISRDVYAEAGNNILIPRGSRIFGSYSTSVERGQARVTINWSRLIRPDGVDAAVSLNAADQFGRAGIEGDINNKYGSVIANSILTSFLASGTAIVADKLSNAGDSTTTTDLTTGSTITSGSAAGQAIYDVSKTIVDTVNDVVNNSINVDPVIRIPQGTRITVVVNSDISLPKFDR